MRFKLILKAERELVRACLDYLTLKGYVSSSTA